MKFQFNPQKSVSKPIVRIGTDVIRNRMGEILFQSFTKENKKLRQEEADQLANEGKRLSRNNKSSKKRD